MAAELLTRVEYKEAGQTEYSKLHSVMSLLSCVEHEWRC